MIGAVFLIRNSTDAAESLRLEYAIYLLKKKGDLSKKVYKIREREIDSGDQLEVNRKHHFKPVTMRTY